MKNFAFAAAVLLVGCATTAGPSSPDERIKLMEQRSAEIAQRERHCIDAAMSKTSDEVARIGIAQEPTANEETRIAKAEGEHQLQRCIVEAERENDELSSQERAEYKQQAEEERQRSSLMMILTTSRPP